MGGWLYTATPQHCARCPAVATLHGRTRLCEECAAEARDRQMMREYPQWYVPQGSRLRGVEPLQLAAMGWAS